MISGVKIKARTAFHRVCWGISNRISNSPTAETNSFGSGIAEVSPIPAPNTLACKVSNLR